MALLATGCGAKYASGGDLPATPTTGNGTGATGTGASGGGNGSGTTGSCGTDTWNNYAAAFFANNCESCHQHTTEFSSESAVLAKASSIESYVNQGLMPQGAPLSQADRDRLAAWLGCPDGAPATSTGTTTGSTTGATSTNGTGGTSGSCDTWANSVGAWFSNNCAACHVGPNSPNAPGATLDATNEVSVLTDNAIPTRLGIAAGQPLAMPQGQLPGTSPTDAEKQRIVTWWNNRDNCPSTTTGTTGTSTSGTTSTSGSTGTTGTCSTYTWADVQPLFASYCVSCHSAAGTYPQYVHLDDQAASTADAANIFAYVNAGAMPLSGSPALSASDKAIVLGWASNPSGQCGGSSGSTGTTTGTTGATTAGSLGLQAACVNDNWGSAGPVWDGDSNMNPGDNCFQCHNTNPNTSGQNGPLLEFGGTAYDSMAGAALSSDATITVIDSGGRTATVSTDIWGNGNGNFSTRGTSLVPPYQVSISRNGSTLYMLHLAPSGACNSCHTQSPAASCSSAGVTPGRVFAP
ncbi:MAG: hypothetical protein JST54_28615 [Deltaproteobacteria bacterium]|nr:hypothetical protein [Deltaproteobacteria bacterium]